MTKPSDFTPERVLEVQHPPMQEPVKAEREVWAFRILGIVLLAAVWAAIVMREGIGSTEFFAQTGALAGLGAYAFAAAARTRRMAVNTEKRLRLGLLVHNMELENMAMQDDLTRLFNRRYFFDRLERELSTAEAFQRPLSVILLDLDDMKRVNDTHGHRVGDELLRNFGKFLLDHTRGSDVPARIGGDEFAIILPDTPVAEARRLQDRLTEKLAKIDIVDNDEVTLQAAVSLGCAGYPETAQTVDELIQQSDSAMYAAKHDHKVNAALGSAGEARTPVPPAFRKLETETS